MDEDLRALEREGQEDAGALFRLHAALDRRFLPEAPPLTEALDQEVAELGARVADLLSGGWCGEVHEPEVAWGIVFPEFGGEGVRWEWLERSAALVGDRPRSRDGDDRRHARSLLLRALRK